MIYKFTIPGKLDGLNELVNANRKNRYAGAKLKANNEEIIMYSLNRLRNVKIDGKVLIYYKIYEQNKRRDHDNILSTMMKFTQDSLVARGILKGDGWKNIHRSYYDIYVDKDNPRTEVVLTELTKEQYKLDLFNLLKDLEV